MAATHQVGKSSPPALKASKGNIDNWCDPCGEVRRFEVVDPGSCKCTVCGHVDVMTVPLKPGSQAAGR